MAIAHFCGFKNYPYVMYGILHDFNLTQSGYILKDRKNNKIGRIQYSFRCAEIVLYEKIYKCFNKLEWENVTAFGDEHNNELATCTRLRSRTIVNNNHQNIYTIKYKKFFSLGNGKISINGEIVGLVEPINSGLLEIGRIVTLQKELPLHLQAFILAYH